ncbi:MAG: type II toxin-antitoxin system HicB family antitoxin [Alphaproteobacteria bacterium]|nr:type II toxin-antitoxin system HicB family antitoxin [Alphaproteobacteria bacterium]
MAKKQNYVALIEHDKGTLYGVRFPDLPGCYSAGESAAAAAENAMEAVRLWAEVALDRGESPPVVRPPDEVLADEAIRNAIVHGAVPILVPL